MSDTVGGPALHAICRSAATAVPPSPYFSADAVSRPQLKKTRSGPSSRGGRCGRLFQLSEKSARCLVHIGNTLERRLLHVSVLLCLVGSVGWCWPVISEFRSRYRCRRPKHQFTHWFLLSSFKSVSGKSRFRNRKIGSLQQRDLRTLSRSACDAEVGHKAGSQDPARIVARERSGAHTRFARRSAAARVKHAAKAPKPSLKPPVRLASLEGAAPPVEANPSHIPSNVGALTSLVDFETAPFPYHGSMPNSGQPFLNAGAEGHWGHVNFRGNVLWEVSDFQ